MEKFNLRITQKVHVLVHQVPEYVRLTRVQLGPTLEQAPASQHRFLIYSTTDSKWIVQPPPSLENIYSMLYNIITRAKNRFTVYTLSSIVDRGRG